MVRVSLAQLSHVRNESAGVTDIRTSVRTGSRCNMDITTRDWQLYSAWQQSQNGALTSVTIRALLIVGQHGTGSPRFPSIKTVTFHHICCSVLMVGCRNRAGVLIHGTFPILVTSLLKTRFSLFHWREEWRRAVWDPSEVVSGTAPLMVNPPVHRAALNMRNCQTSARLPHRPSITWDPELRCAAW